MPSAIAKQPIFPGAAVAQSADSVVLASPSLLATHIVQTGAPMGGIASMTAIGNVTLTDWTLATGSKSLKTGATYYVAIGGRLSPVGSGQPVGIATSIQTLSVTIQSQQTVSSSTSGLSAAIAALQSQISALTTQVNNIKVPFLYAGRFAIANASNTGTVTGLGILNFMPTKAIATVRSPSNGLVMFATVESGTITQDGFTFILSGVTDSANYLLDFIMLP